MAILPEPLPINDPLVHVRRRDLRPDEEDPYEGHITETWIRSLSTSSESLSATSQRVALEELTTQGASISVTSLVTDPSSGLYSLTYYAKIRRAGTVSSSLTVTFAWTDDGDSISVSGSAITGNTVSTVQTGTLLIHTDESTPLTYATTYASVGATSMQYDLYIVVSRVAA